MLANLIANLTCLREVHTFYVNWTPVDLETNTVLLPYLFSMRQCRQEREKSVNILIQCTKYYFHAHMRSASNIFFASSLRTLSKHNFFRHTLAEAHGDKHIKNRSG